MPKIKAPCALCSKTHARSFPLRVSLEFNRDTKMWIVSNEDVCPDCAKAIAKSIRQEAINAFCQRLTIDRGPAEEQNYVPYYPTKGVFD